MSTHQKGEKRCFQRKRDEKSKEIMKNFEKTRVRSLVKKMYLLFHPDGQKSTRSLRLIPSSEALLKLPGSKPTIIAARKRLQINVKKIAGHYYWQAPKLTPDQALQREKKIDYICLDDINCPGKGQARTTVLASVRHPRCAWCNGRKLKLVRASVEEIRSVSRVMQMHGYAIERNQMLFILQRRRNPYAAKKHLGIVTRRVEGIYYWCWYEPVITWLDDLLGERERVPVAELNQLASSLKIRPFMLETAIARLRRLRVQGEYLVDTVNYSPPGSASAADEENAPPIFTPEDETVPTVKGADYIPASERDRRFLANDLRERMGKETDARRRSDMQAYHDKLMEGLEPYRSMRDRVRWLEQELAKMSARGKENK